MSAPGLGYEILGAVKVKDGLFIGDELAAQDLEFVVANKVTRVINCCGRQVPNHWEPIGVIYLTYFWVDADNQIVLDPRDVVANEIFRFIEEALEGAESVLIHSVRGQSRSCCVLSAYMMKKYNWGLRKTMEFLSSRRPDLNLKPSFLQQLSGYERRLMSQSKHNFSLDWNDADFSRLESEELLLRNTYLNSQMGPLAEFHDSQMGIQGKPRKLLWADNNVDDKIRLEKPAGADRHNVTNGSRNQMGQPILKSVVKVPKYTPKGGTPEQQSLQHRASSNENPQEAHPQYHELHFPGASVPKAPPAVPSIAGPGAPPLLGHPMQGGPSSVAPPSGITPHSQQQVPGLSGPPDHSSSAMPTYTFNQQNVPTAWGAEPQSIAPGYAVASSGTAPASMAGPYPHSQAQQPAEMPPGYQHQQQQGMNQALFQPRGPATIRDSLLGLSRRDSPEPSRTSGSRDPSPKTSSKRDSPLPTRGESPLRLINRSGRGSSPGVQSRDSYPGKPQASGPSSGGYNPQLGNLGLCLGGIRPPGPSGGGGGAGMAAPGRGGPPGSGGPGMGAFRSGGPVRAKANVLGEQGDDGHSSMRRSRPVTTTGPGGQRGSGSRPASPLGGQRGSGSRPSSPQTRPGSPGPSQQAQRLSASGPYPSPVSGAYPGGTPLTTKQRSLSSHMRRAPSPTPAFNRNPSPSRPRWRS